MTVIHNSKNQYLDVHQQGKTIELDCFAVSHYKDGQLVDTYYYPKYFIDILEKKKYCSVALHELQKFKTLTNQANEN